MGDSLSDSGVFTGIPGFGRVFSVQGSTSEPNTIWTERTAAILGAPALCNFYKFTGSTFIANTVAGCTSYAIGGGRINNPASSGGAASPQSIVTQLQQAGAIAGTYAATDLLLIDGGGNDAADLVGSYLGASSPAGAAAYGALLSTVLPPATVATTLAGGATGAAQAGGLYMTALADKFYAAIKANALDKGAKQVAVLNMPGITNTPRFQMVLDSISAAYGGGTAGATARAQSEGLFKSWIVAFNTQLAAKVAGDTRVTLIDFYTNFNDQVANPAQFGLTNVKTPACPITGVGSDGLPSYNFQTCTAAALSAMTPPAGATGGADWWKTYAFSDGFHPTPYGYQLLGQLVSKSLAQAGWL
jgi:phospholipase/lecithinase/hemolysin